MYQKSLAHFAIWWYTTIYVLAMIVLALHLRHGVKSAFQTMGWRHPTWTPGVRTLGNVYAISIPMGFAVIPIYFLISA